jgi:DNA-binding response OmpR family regulator
MTPGQYILVVDDDDDFRETLSEVLSEAGYPVQQAENGEVALAKTADEAPGMVLLDLKMPVLDGWGVMERMRNDARSAGVPILVLSAFGFEWEAELLGAQGYIPKSVGMEEILDRVRRAAGPPPMRH